jgi:hypothetical protein
MWSGPVHDGEKCLPSASAHIVRDNFPADQLAPTVSVLIPLDGDNDGVPVGNSGANGYR